MRDDEDELLLLPEVADDCFDDSPAVDDEYFAFDDPDGDDLESFVFVVDVLEVLEGKMKSYNICCLKMIKCSHLNPKLLIFQM